MIKVEKMFKKVSRLLYIIKDKIEKLLLNRMRYNQNYLFAI